MTTRTVLLTGAVMFGLGLRASAGMPPPDTYTFYAPGASSLGAWDVSGTYDDNGSGFLSGGFTLSTDATGKFTGSGDASFSEGGIAIDLGFTVNGSVKTVKNITTVQMGMKFAGTGYFEDAGREVPVTFSGAFTYKMAVDQDSLTMEGSLGGKMRLSAKGYGSESFTLEEMNDGEPLQFSADLPAGMDGSWNLRIQMGTDAKGKPIVVTATVTLSNGRPLDLSGKVSYSAKADVSTLTLKGSKDFGSNGATLKLSGLGSGLDITACAGKLLGQTVKQ